ncbi:MAG TPA: hypothetical protein VK641_17730 [Terriglobales bacterium]|nr:hypothetical protein [Terriglobales bacterium]
MKISIITDHNGALVGTIRGHETSAKLEGMTAGVLLGPGQKIHHVDVPEDLAKLESADEFHAKLVPHIPKA